MRREGRGVEMREATRREEQGEGEQGSHEKVRGTP